jgi:ABC-type multidrug transport system ATPase subunit
VGLGFDEEAQHRALDGFSGGWRMRVALASLLFSKPDLLLLDEPSNHLDLEAVLWLEDFLRSYPATILLVSHERDFLNNVVDHILHLDRGKLTLYPAAMTRSSGSGPSGRRSSLPRAPSSRPSARSCRIISRGIAPAPRRPSRLSRGPRRWRGCSRSPSCLTIRR